ncbi:MAG: hypothetical protein JSU07_10545 [Bacteroidetes bacterium]|nr:hypothetical protein [Bacteroidota bacterium]
MTIKKTHTIQVFIAFAAIALPLLASLVKKDSKPNLVGQVISDEKPKITLSTWLDRSYQFNIDDYNADHWAFKEKMVRLNNQLYYELFNQLRVNGFVSGKENYVFSEGYIFSAFGDDLIYENAVDEKIRKAKVIQDTLAKKGITLLLAFAPGKGVYCKNYVQDKYVHAIKNTNHNLFINACKKYKVNALDIYSYFEKLKSSTPYPLFPKYGHHWSYYGACIATDTIIKTIEHLTKRDLPNMFWKTVELSDTARSRDADVLNSMNLYEKPEQNIKLAYPNIEFEQDSIKNTTPVLTISDSYWYDQVYMGVWNNCFAGGRFWYYYNKVIPSPVQGEKIEVWQLDLKKEIESNKVIMLLYSDGNLPMFANAFIDDAYLLYTNPSAYKIKNEKHVALQSYAKQIRETPLMLKKATQLSNDHQITLDSAIKINATKMLNGAN